MDGLIEFIKEIPILFWPLFIFWAFIGWNSKGFGNTGGSANTKEEKKAGYHTFMWIVQDIDGTVSLHREKPEPDPVTGTYTSTGCVFSGLPGPGDTYENLGLYPGGHPIHIEVSVRNTKNKSGEGIRLVRTFSSSKELDAAFRYMKRTRKSPSRQIVGCIRRCNFLYGFYCRHIYKMESCAYKDKLLPRKEHHLN